MPPHLPTTSQLVAGIWLRLRILGPLLMAPIAVLWMVGVLPSTGTRTVGALILLTVLALDSARHPHGTRQGADR